MMDTKLIADIVAGVIEETGMRGDFGWGRTEDFCEKLEAAFKEAAAGAPDLRSAILALERYDTTYDGMENDKRGNYVLYEDVAALASAAPVDAELQPEYEVDPMDVVRTLVCIADRMAELPEEKREFYPSPTSNDSPLMIAARNACVERGFTAGGLAIESPKPGGAS